MKRVTWKHTSPYIKHTANGNSLYDSRNSRDGEGDGRDVQVGEDIGKPMADPMLIFGKNQHNTVKQLSFN